MSFRVFPTSFNKQKRAMSAVERLSGALGSLDITNVAIVFGLFYFINLAMKKEPEQKENQKEYQRTQPDLSHSDPSKAPVPRNPSYVVRM